MNMSMIHEVAPPPANPRRRILLLALAGLAGVLPGGARAATPTAFFEYSGIVGEGSTISITRVPVEMSNGKIVYKDVTIEFSVEPNGTLDLVAGSPSQAPSPVLNTSHFQAGMYFTQVAASVAFGTLAGGGPGSGGSTEWTFSVVNAPSGYQGPVEASWQTLTPPVDLQGRITNDKIVLDPALSYGSEGQGNYWRPDSLIAAQQVANTLNIETFTNPGNGADYSSPQASVVFTRCADASCSNAPQ